MQDKKMQDVQKVPSAKADGNILSQEIKKTVNLFHNNSYVRFLPVIRERNLYHACGKIVR
jgi:hypothetical protein